jgi:PAS domain S-box-containing protein
MKTIIAPTKTELFFEENDIIVSKTDVNGRITYANQSFCHMAGYSEAELLGQPHSIIRHPDMPRAVLKLLWDTVLDRREIFAYVKNMSMNGDFYWVFAHVTPSFDAKGNVIGFHSSRRVPDSNVLTKTIIPLYADILREEKRHQNRQQELAAASINFLKSRNTTYDALIFSL